jgi:hypothetical protein
MELAQNGDLQQKIGSARKNRLLLKEFQIWAILRQILQGFNKLVFTFPVFTDNIYFSVICFEQYEFLAFTIVIL